MTDLDKEYDPPQRRWRQKRRLVVAKRFPCYLHYLALRVYQLMWAGGDGRVGNQLYVCDSVTGLLCVHVSLFTQPATARNV
jgi:hypothetical protein